MYFRAVARFSASVFCTLLLAGTAGPASMMGSASAQDLESGIWNGLMVTPGGEYAEMEFDITSSSESLRALVKWKTGEVEISNLRLEGDLLTFTWSPTFYLACRLERAENGQFKGACLDSRENVGPAVLSPPGLRLEKGDVDFEKAFEVWNISREEYMEEHYPQPKKQIVKSAEPRILPSHLVDVDGRQMSVSATGAGRVTIVLESGYGDDHTVWEHVQDAVSRKTRVISYDRAGLGRSQEAPSPRTPAQLAEELRATLKAAGEEPPYLLVAHGSGAFTVREFLRRFPSKVAGLVLVDPAHEEVDDALRELDAQSWQDYVSRKRSFLTSISPAAASEFEGFLDVLDGASTWTVPGEARVPAVVVSTGGAKSTGHWIGATPEGVAAKKALQRTIADELGAEFVAADGSGGYIHLDAPSVIVDAVGRILDNIDEGQ